MNRKTDIVSLKWVVGLMKVQADDAEKALINFGNNPTEKKPLLRCMWSVHQITSTLKALGMRKAEMLTLEMERSLNFLYKDKLGGERAKLALGGLMQCIKILPAYLEYTESVREDTGRGLEPFINDMRRWMGQKPKSKAYFFYMEIAPTTGISEDGTPASDEEIIKRATVMLALYLEMAKQGLRGRKTVDSMKTVARIARKMKMLFAGTTTERFWFALIGMCEGVAGGLIKPDECIAQIFKAGAFSIKQAREQGVTIDREIDYESYVLQMLYYIASCKGSPVHISAIRKTFGITAETIPESEQGLIHSDAIIVSLEGALERLNSVIEFLDAKNLKDDISRAAKDGDMSYLDAIEGAEHRMLAAGQMGHVDTLRKVYSDFRPLFTPDYEAHLPRLREIVGDISQGIVSVRDDIEYKLKHGLNSTYCGKDFELRETVTTATFAQMSMVENHLHQILRRKALQKALESKPTDFGSIVRLTTAIQRYLNKQEDGDEELRELVTAANNGEGDVERLYEMARDYLDGQETATDSSGLDESLGLLDNISGALLFAGMEREGAVIAKCHRWLAAAHAAACVEEDESFNYFAEAFAQIEMHLQRLLLDPLEDTSHMVSLAEQRAAALESFARDLEGSAVIVDANRAKSDDTVAIEEEELELHSLELDLTSDAALLAAGEKSLTEPPEAEIDEPEEIVLSSAQPTHTLSIAPERKEDPGALTDGLGQQSAQGRANFSNRPLVERTYVEDTEMSPEFREVFMEEAEEIVEDLAELTTAWLKEPGLNETLRDIRRHFHTFKGSGRAVGANVIGELGWAAQDMLDRVLDGDLPIDTTLQDLLQDLSVELPSLVASYRSAESAALHKVRALTDACFDVAEGKTPSYKSADSHSVDNTLSSAGVVDISSATKSFAR